jgi:hypothetical protein
MSSFIQSTISILSLEVVFEFNSVFMQCPSTSVTQVGVVHVDIADRQVFEESE